MKSETTHILGMRIISDKTRKLWLVQDSYIDAFAQKYKVSSTLSSKTPIPTIPLYHSMAKYHSNRSMAINNV